MAIPIVDGLETGDFYTITDFPPVVLANNYDSIKIGSLFISSTGATLNGDSINFGNEVSVLTDNPITRRHRNLEDTEGRIVSVLRVSMEAGPVQKREVEYSVADIEHQYFDTSNPISIVNQYENCSNGKLKMVPGGVYEVTMPGEFTDYSSPAALRNEALSILAKQLAIASASEITNHMVVILPPNEYPGKLARIFRSLRRCMCLTFFCFKRLCRQCWCQPLGLHTQQHVVIGRDGIYARNR